MSAPLYESLLSLAGAGALRMHMPGHKGKLPFVPALAEAAALDYTELAATGNLYEGGGAIGEAEALYAQAFSMAQAQFLTGGASQGVFTALFYAKKRGNRILMDRGSHFSAYNACALLDLEPRYLYPERLAPFFCQGAVTAQAVDEALEKTPAAAVLLTSPSYYGVCCDLAAVGAVCRRRGALLIVDGAHGAHLPFLPGWAGCFSGADILIASAHKTLPALGQAALLFSGEGVDGAALRRASALFGTSSPSYVLMASLDAARAYMEAAGRTEYSRAAQRLAALRRRSNARGRIPALTGPGLDPLRLVLCCAQAGLSGFAGAARLEKDFQIVPEMADLQNILCIVTGQDSDGDLDRLEKALEALEAAAPGKALPLPEAPPPAQAACSPAQALFAEKSPLSLRQCAGRISGEGLILYPPGQPLVAPGEIIQQKHLAYLERMRYNMDRTIEVLNQ